MRFSMRNSVIRPIRSLAVGRRTTGWPKKVSHYQESSLNRIKTRH